jgi:Tol biopolymer transport system component
METGQKGRRPSARYTSRLQRKRNSILIAPRKQTITDQRLDPWGRRSWILAILTCLFCTTIGIGPPSLAKSEDLILASTSSAGEKGVDTSNEPSLSADGKHVAFVYYGMDLDAQDPNLDPDVYVKNLQTGELVFASTLSGAQANEDALDPSLADDGTKVAFVVGGYIYLKDLNSGELMLVSSSEGGTPADAPSRSPSISGDGTRVAFTSRANLDPADWDYNDDVYIKNVKTGDLTLASTTDSGKKPEGFLNGSAMEGPVLSEDGTDVVFSYTGQLDPADSEGYPSVYMKDILTEEVVYVGQGQMPDLSGDGRMVAFSSGASLDPADSDEASDVYVMNIRTGQLILCSVSEAGVKANGASGPASLSSDGSTVAFTSTATNLDPNDGDGDFDVYVRNLETREVLLASESATGEKGNEFSHVGSLSADGTLVSFWSPSTNLHPAVTRSVGDVYVKVLGGPSGPPPGPSAEMSVVFVHGIDVLGRKSGDPSEWGPMKDAFDRWGWSRSKLIAVGYYQNDSEFDRYLDAYGGHLKHFGGNDEHTRGNAHDRNTDIRHLANHWAWYVYKEFSKDGTSIKAVGHSMGGLIIRYALARVQEANSEFPPRLLVDEVVTLGTPHGGTRLVEYCSGLVDQCRQMRRGDDFVKELKRSANNPQASSGTEWTAIGSYFDEQLQPDETAVDDDMDAAHRVMYLAEMQVLHSDYYKDVFDRIDADVRYSDYADTWRRLSARKCNDSPWPVRWVFLTLSLAGPVAPCG